MLPAGWQGQLRRVGGRPVGHRADVIADTGDDGQPRLARLGDGPGQRHLRVRVSPGTACQPGRVFSLQVRRETRNPEPARHGHYLQPAAARPDPGDHLAAGPGRRLQVQGLLLLAWQRRQGRAGVSLHQLVQGVGYRLGARVPAGQPVTAGGEHVAFPFGGALPAHADEFARYEGAGAGEGDGADPLEHRTVGDQAAGKGCQAG